MKPMMLHQKVFWAGVFFLGGVALMSVMPPVSGLRFALLVGILVSLGFALLGRYALSACALFLLIGSGYYALRVPVSDVDFALPERFTGTVVAVRTYSERHLLTITTPELNGSAIAAYVPRYPVYGYGDIVHVSGAIKKLERDDSRFLRDRIIGVVWFPDMSLIEERRGVGLRGKLYLIRDAIADRFARSLPAEEAAFLTGLTLGKSAVFSDTLQEQLRITGTTHLVALSGSNVTVIIRGVMILFGLWFSRRALFPLTLTAITLFVLMTGAEASVVRAALMAGVVLLAERTGRVHDTRIAIVCAAVVMVLINPAVLVFDIGFQLSFFALLGIVYLEPLLADLLRVDLLKSRPLRAFAHVITTTLAAQVAVFPLSLFYFEFASVIALVPNALILLLIPYTMLMGLVVFLAGLFSHLLALLFAFPARLMLSYELGVIEFFSRFQVGVTTRSLPLIFVMLYYAVLIVVIFWARRKKHMVL